jgi:hypothetical protein
MQIQGLSCLVKDLKLKEIAKEMLQHFAILFVNDLDLVD